MLVNYKMKWYAAELLEENNDGYWTVKYVLSVVCRDAHVVASLTPSPPCFNDPAVARRYSDGIQQQYVHPKFISPAQDSTEAAALFKFGMKKIAIAKSVSEANAAINQMQRQVEEHPDVSRANKRSRGGSCATTADKQSGVSGQARIPRT